MDDVLRVADEGEPVLLRQREVEIVEVNLLGPLDVGLQDGERFAAEPRHSVLFAQFRAKPFGDVLQQHVADRVTEPNPSFIVPSVFDASVAPAVAEAVRQAAVQPDPAAAPEGYSAKDGVTGA